jgi:isopentenyl diphosphate isomerase/L-lactate dehydrogenase-like FMN-dependent dehydrogenase
MTPTDAANIADLRALARRRLPRALFEYIDRGAEDEVALDANRVALDALKIRPRVLRGVASRDTGQMLFGSPLRLPIVVAPTAVAGMLWHDGDVLSARAAARAGIPYTLSTFSVTTLERVARATTGGRLWFQLYMLSDRDHVRSLVRRAHGAGYEALVVTVDGPVPPKREYNARNGFSMPIRFNARLACDVALHPRWLLGVAIRYLLEGGIPGMAHHAPGSASERIARNRPDASIDWDSVAELRALFPGKLLLKGILHPEDAILARRLGVDGVVVSNHGGRNLDASLATIDALPDVVSAMAGSVPVLVDSGFQRGSDVVKALALGATAVMAGRSMVWGVASFGSAGVARAIAIFEEEIDRVMAQAGCRQLGDISSDLLWNRPAAPSVTGMIKD